MQNGTRKVQCIYFRIIIIEFNLNKMGERKEY